AQSPGFEGRALKAGSTTPRTTALRYSGARAASRRKSAATARAQTSNRLRSTPPTPRPQSAPGGRNGASGSRSERPREYLERLGCGFGACGVSPELSLGIAGHSEEEGHTMYEISCALRPSESSFSPTAWSCRKRLCHLREGLHDVIKESLGDAYASHFDEAPFARYGGLPGTTGRLGAWLAVLTRVLNSGVLSESTCAKVLHFLDAPVPEGRSHQEG
ncbi:unnamed protein product, partial [Polarella glacialis]